MQVITRQTIVERRQPFARWSAIFAGTAVSIGLWVLFQILGMGAGLAAVDVNDAGTLVRAGIGTTVWSLIAPILALFVGGIVAGRLAGTMDRGSRAMHGTVMWALTLVLGVVTTLGIVSAIATGAVQWSGVQVRSGSAMHDDAVTHSSLRLHTTETPATSEQPEGDSPSPAATPDTTEAAPRGRAPYAGRSSEQETLRAIDAIGKALLWAGLSLVLSLGAAIIGSLTGTSRGRGRPGPREPEVAPEPRTEVPPEPPPATPTTNPEMVP